MFVKPRFRDQIDLLRCRQGQAFGSADSGYRKALQLLPSYLGHPREPRVLHQAH